MINPRTPQRIHDALPDVKLIAILRNPVERAYSHYQHQVRAGRESLSFEEAIRQEASRLEGEAEKMLADPNYESYNHRKFSYVERGKYIDQIKEWERYFKKEQMLILIAEEFWENPDATFKQIFDFLGVKDYPVSSGKKHNAGNYKDKMSPELRAELETLYKPYNEALYTYLGRDLGWD